MIDAVLCGCGRALPHRGMCASKWAARGGRPKAPAKSVETPTRPPKAKRRFQEHFNIGNPLYLEPYHPAVLRGHTIFPTRVFAADVQDRLLKSGEHQRKIGSHVEKGWLAGAPIFTLTLEERATCPRSCSQWRNCMGNQMPWSRRIAADDTLMDRLYGELTALAEAHPRFLVRLHILGDFFSVDYVEFWRAQLVRLPQLNIFGYTARRDDAIATAIDAINLSERCWIRRSDGRADEFRAIVVDDPDHAAAVGAIVCPVQTGRTACCGTCSLCWATSKTIAFLRH